MKYSVLLTFLILISCNNIQKKKIIDKYGISYNNKRKLAGIPLVSPAMKLTEDTKGERYLFTYPKRDDSLPRHMWKALLVDSFLNLHFESDYLRNPKTKSWVIVNHNYKTNITTYDYQYEPKAEYSVSLGAIDRPLYDSILTSWKIELYKDSLPNK